MLINMEMLRLGEIGEDTVADSVRELSKLPLIRNLHLKNTEIDMILITPFCIYVIEVKHWFGEVDCYLHLDNWLLKNSAGEKDIFSPLLQNKYHIAELQREVGIALPLESLVIFSNRNIILNRPKLQGFPVYKLSEFLEFYKSKYYAVDDKYSLEEQRSFYSKIIKLGDG